MAERYKVVTWFERDRAMVSLQRADETEIVTWWDDDVRELVEDGFLDPRNWLGSATQYARHLGLLPAAE